MLSIEFHFETSSFFIVQKCNAEHTIYILLTSKTFISIILQKLSTAQLDKIFPAFCRTKNSLPCNILPLNQSYFNLVEILTSHLLRPVLILFSCMHQGLQGMHSLPVFYQKVCMHFPARQYMLHIPTISSNYLAFLTLAISGKERKF